MRARVERFTEPAILLLLRESPKHGYQLLERLPELSAEAGHVDLGNLYRLLRAMEGEDLVSSAWQTDSGPPRRVYKLTATGARLLDGWAGSLRDVRRTVDDFLTQYEMRR